MKQHRWKTRSNLSPSSERRLTSYALAAGTVALGALAFTTTSEAEVVYTPTYKSLPLQTYAEGTGYPLDLNGDGIPDLAVVNQGDNTVSILLGSSGAQFPTMTTYPTGKAPMGIITGDFTGNGNLDLATVNNCTANATAASPCAATDYSVSILLGNGDGTFGTPAAVSAATSWGPVAVADMNNDGKVDVLAEGPAPSGAAYQLWVFPGNGNGTFFSRFP